MNVAALLPLAAPLLLLPLSSQKPRAFFKKSIILEVKDHGDGRIYHAIARPAANRFQYLLRWAYAPLSERSIFKNVEKFHTMSVNRVTNSKGNGECNGECLTAHTCFGNLSRGYTSFKFWTSSPES